MKIWQISLLFLIAIAGIYLFGSCYAQQQETIVVPVSHAVEDMARAKGLIVIKEDMLCIKKSASCASAEELISIAEKEKVPIRYTYQIEKVPFYPTVTKRYAAITPAGSFIWDTDKYEIQKFASPGSSALYMPEVSGERELLCKKSLSATFMFDCVVMPGIAIGTIFLARWFASNRKK